MSAPGPVTRKVAERWFLATVERETSAFDDLRENVGPVLSATVERLSGEPPPYKLPRFGGAPPGVAKAYFAAFHTVPVGLVGLPEKAPADPTLGELAAALLEWGGRWRYLRTPWALQAALLTVTAEAFGATNGALEAPGMVGEVHGRRGGEPEPVRFEAPPWYPTPAGPRRMPRAAIRRAFERCLDGYERRQTEAFRQAGGDWPEAKRDDRHFRWLVWRLEGDSEGRIARRAHVKKPVVSRETGALAALLELPVTFAPGR